MLNKGFKMKKLILLLSTVGISVLLLSAAVNSKVIEKRPPDDDELTQSKEVSII